MPNKKLSQIGEFGLINLIAKLAGKSKNLIKGIGDDAAVLPYTKDKYLLLTTDMLLEGVHFVQKDGAQAIGHKALACNISDIAAMGGVPIWVVISLGVPANLKINFIWDLYKGVSRLAKKFNVTIVGGDTNASSKIIISIAHLGEVAKKDLVLRSGAKKNDMIFVTGPLGGSLKNKKHLQFIPRLAESQYLVKHFKPTAMIDISDGLASDLKHILDQSKAGAFVYEKFIPKAKGVNLKQALSDGEDFELLFTLSPKEANRFLGTKKDFPFFYIGRIVDKKEGFVLINQDGRAEDISLKGFRHF